MLKRVHIKNFRSCRDTSIEHLSGMVALVGRNGAGKTNALRAIDWLARISTRAEYAAESFKVTSRDIAPRSVEIEAEVGNRTYIYRLEASVLRRTKKSGMRIDIKLIENLRVRLNGGPFRTILERDGQKVTSSIRDGVVALSPWVGALIGLTSILPEHDGLVQEIRPMLSFLSSVRYYPIDQPCELEMNFGDSGWIEHESYKDWLSKLEETGNPSNSVPLRILHMWLAMPDRYEQLRDLLGPDGLGLIHGISLATWPENSLSPQPKDSPEPPAFHILKFQPTQCVDEPRYRFSYSDLSTGTRRILKLLVSLLFDASEVMLLEHPEDGLHTGLVMKLIDLLKTNVSATQVIFTSHSSTVLNALDPESIRLVSMDSCETHIRALKPKETKAAARYMAEEGTLAEFLELAEG